MINYWGMGEDARIGVGKFLFSLRLQVLKRIGQKQDAAIKSCIVVQAFVIWFANVVGLLQSLVELSI